MVNLVPVFSQIADKMKGQKSPQHSKGGGTGRPSQLEGILLEHFDLYMRSKLVEMWESNEAVIANVLI